MYKVWICRLIMKKADCLIIVTVIIAIAIVIELFFISKSFLSGKITFFNNSPQSRFSYEEPVSSKIASDVLVDDEVLNEFIDDMGLTNFNNKGIVLTKSDYKKFLAKNRKIIVIDENNNPVKTIYDEKKEKYKIHPSDTDCIDNHSAIPTYVP